MTRFFDTMIPMAENVDELQTPMQEQTVTPLQGKPKKTDTLSCRYNTSHYFRYSLGGFWRPGLRSHAAERCICKSTGSDRCK